MTVTISTIYQFFPVTYVTFIHWATYSCLCQPLALTITTVIDNLKDPEMTILTIYLLLLLRHPHFFFHISQTIPQSFHTLLSNCRSSPTTLGRHIEHLDI